MNKPIKKATIENAVLEQIKEYVDYSIKNYYRDEINIIQHSEKNIDGWFYYNHPLELEGYTIFTDDNTFTKIEFTLPYYCDGLEKRRLAFVFNVSDYQTICFLKRIDFVHFTVCSDFSNSGRRIDNLLYFLEDLAEDKRKLFRVWNTINKTERLRQYKIDNLLNA